MTVCSRCASLSLRITWLLLVAPFIVISCVLSVFAGELEKHGLRIARYAEAEETAGVTLDAEAKDNEAVADTDLAEATVLQDDAAEHAERVSALEADASEKAGVVGEDSVAAAENAGEAAAVQEVPGVDAAADAVKSVEVAGELSTAAGAAGSIMKDEVAAAREGAEAVLARREAQDKDTEAVAAQESAAGEETAAKTAEGEAYASVVAAALYFAVAEAARLVAFILDLPVVLFVGWRWAWPFVATWVAGVWSVLVSLTASVAGHGSMTWRVPVAGGVRKSCLGIFLMALLLDPWCYCILTAAAVESSSLLNAQHLASQFSKVSGAHAGRRLEDLEAIDLVAPSHQNTTASHLPTPIPLLDQSGTLFYDSFAVAAYTAQHWAKGFMGLAQRPLLFVIALDVLSGAVAVACALGWRKCHFSNLWVELRTAMLRWSSLVSMLVALWIVSIIFAVELRSTVEHMQVRKFAAPSMPEWSACFCVMCCCIGAWHAVETAQASDVDADATKQRLAEPLLPTKTSTNGRSSQRTAKPVLTAASTGVLAALAAAFEAVECPVSVWAMGSAVRNLTRCWPLLLLAPWSVLLDKVPMSADTRANIIAAALAIGTMLLVGALCFCKGKR
mmetsp:Transcript_15928/g.29153  ORF Transcript_15928/g.29153 Transcript_15928/m.29153 type:complete len:618 (-) Transcript_15928:180-2033(-)